MTRQTDYEKLLAARELGRVLYPDGYGQWATFFSIEDLMRRHRDQGGASMEPETERRITAYLIHKGGEIGIGDSWRPLGSHTSPASRANKSFHQDQMFYEGSTYFCAVDIVVIGGFSADGELIVREPSREQIADSKEWGLHDMGSGKRHHLGPIEIRGHGTWVSNGRRRPLHGFQLPAPDVQVPDIPEPPAPPAPTPEPPAPPAPTPEPPAPPVEQPTMQGRVNVNVQMVELKKGMNGEHVEKLQSILNANFTELKKDHLKVDGDFGKLTNERVENVQAFFGLKVDGVVGPITWNILLTMPL